MKQIKNLIAPLIVAVLIIGVVLRIYSVYSDDKAQYQKYYNNYSTLIGSMSDDIDTVNNLQEEEEYYEDMLYQTMSSYYQSTDDQVLRYVFQQRFPSSQEYENDRKSAFIIIYALLELYPEMKENDTINENIIGINDTLSTLQRTIDAHNAKVNECNDLIKSINKSDYVKIWNKNAFINNRVNDILFIEE